MAYTDRIIGRDILLEIDITGTPTAFLAQSEGEFERTMEPADVQAKQDNGDPARIAESWDWSATFTQMIEATDAAFSAAETAFDAGNTVTMYANVNGTRKQGTAYITSIRQNAPGKGPATCTVSLVAATGKLTAV